MEWLIVAVIAFVCTAMTLACLVALIARNRLQRHHRVDPALPTEAPLTWLVDPRTPARLHRRLAKVGTSATLVVDDHTPTGRRARKARKAEPSPLAVTAQDVRAQAVLLDRQVTRLAALAPGARKGPLRELGTNVTEVEAAAARLVALSTQVQAPRGLDTDDGTLAAVTDQLDRLTEAHRQLLELDEGNGLRQTPLPAPPLAPAPAPEPERQTWPPTGPDDRR